MKVVRCKDCALSHSIECPLTYIEHHTLQCIDHPQNFYCGKAMPKEGYKLTRGDRIRNLTDRQLAGFISTCECEAYQLGRDGGTMQTGKANEDFWAVYLGTKEGEDYE